MDQKIVEKAFCSWMNFKRTFQPPGNCSHLGSFWIYSPILSLSLWHTHTHFIKLNNVFWSQMPSTLRHRAYDHRRRVASAIKKSKLCLHLYLRRNADEMRPVTEAFLSYKAPPSWWLTSVSGRVSPRSSRCGPPAALPRPSRHSAESARPSPRRSGLPVPEPESPRPSPQPRLRPSRHSAEPRADCAQASCSLSRAPRVRTGRIVKVPGLEGHCKENTRTWWADAVSITWGSGSTVWSPDAVLRQVVFGFLWRYNLVNCTVSVNHAVGGAEDLVKDADTDSADLGSLKPPWVSKTPPW